MLHKKFISSLLQTFRNQNSWSTNTRLYASSTNYRMSEQSVTPLIAVSVLENCNKAKKKKSTHREEDRWNEERI